MLTYNRDLDSSLSPIFYEIEKKITKNKNKVFYPLHQGKTWLFPSADSLSISENKFGIYSYQHASVLGMKPLLERIIRTEHKKNNFISEDQIMVTNGATHAIFQALCSILDAKDEVLVLSPHWMFINGIIRNAKGIPVEVPLFQELAENEKFDIVKQMKSFLSNKTKAIYFNSPNNPSGYTFSKEQLQLLASFARQNKLWIIADNAYENYDFYNENFIDIFSLDEAENITFSIYSFSKTYSIPGYRIGYMLFPLALHHRVVKSNLYSVYSVSTVSQLVACNMLDMDPNILIEKKVKVQKSLEYFLDNIAIPCKPARGGLYVFLNLNTISINYFKFLSLCLDNGVSLVPGEVFGANYNNYVRVCYSAISFEELKKAIVILNNLYSFCKKTVL